jgi:hypothetical protein
MKLSKFLLDCMNNCSNLQLNYYSDSDVNFFTVPMYRYPPGYYVYFDPWLGKEIEGTFEIYMEESEHLNTSRKNWEAKICGERSKHFDGTVCEELSWFLKGGVEEYLTPLVHIPNIRTYAILNKKEYGGFEPMDYCPFCGAKFPERLDDKLTEILQKEYGLGSWKDYKKAPPEFQTDEWWKNREL